MRMLLKSQHFFHSNEKCLCLTHCILPIVMLCSVRYCSVFLQIKMCIVLSIHEHVQRAWRSHCVDLIRNSDEYCLKELSLAMRWPLQMKQVASCQKCVNHLLKYLD